ncbi:MAG: FeoB-associated Cys-rich membrane protein [Lachnospiraceae bacterium]|nr:FeoB-associated Cys-rich membrane protein [Lachnospiraceae bacterium]MCI9150198.1 FeoB-associated Cys-rich membrane protein [Lachnospiraceae bacterium]
MGTVIVAAIVIAAAGFALYTLRKDRRKGGGCSGDCGSCKGCH